MNVFNWEYVKNNKGIYCSLGPDSKPDNNFYININNVIICLGSSGRTLRIVDEYYDFNNNTFFVKCGDNATECIKIPEIVQGRYYSWKDVEKTVGVYEPVGNPCKIISNGVGLVLWQLQNSKRLAVADSSWKECKFRKLADSYTIA